MTSNPSIKLPLRNVTPANKAPQTEQPIPNTYSPSVPISVYRELAAELQAAQAMLESLNAQNQHLARQNQQLREEIEKVVQSHLHLHQLAASFQPIGRVEPPQPQVQVQPKSEQRAHPIRDRQASQVKPPAPFSAAPAPAPKPEPILSYEVEETFTEQEEGRYQRPTPEENSSVSGWFLIIAIFLIVTTAFGAGFLIVRPLLNNSSNSNSR